MGSIVLLVLMGGVALLLWGLHMVRRSGIMRAFGSELRRVLSSYHVRRRLRITTVMFRSRCRSRVNKVAFGAFAGCLLLPR